MSVRFVIGRAGSGKTHHCLSEVRRKLVESPLDGPRLILLVPEQAGLQTEQALLSTGEPCVTHRAEVTSFRRLAARICGPDNGAGRSALSPVGRSMVLRHLLARLADQLTYFRNTDRMPGFIERLGKTIDELINEAVDEEHLAATVDRAPDDPLRRHKLDDLHRLYSAYLAYLGDRRVDPSQLLQIARGRMTECDWLDGAEMWVDGFAGFTRQEHLTLMSLARLAGRMSVTLLLDPRCADRRRAASVDGTDLWAKTARTYVELCRSFDERGIEVEPPTVLDPGVLPRFAVSPPLEILERAIFQHESPAASEGEPAVHVVEAPDRRVEVDYAVAEIVRRTESDGLRYRDIGVTMRDLGLYHDLLAAALDAKNIPYFIDRRRPTNHHPLVEWVRGLLQLAVDDLAPATVRLLLKTGLLPLERDEADRIDNHLVATDVSGLEAWSRPWDAGGVGAAPAVTPARERAAAERTERLNEARRTLLARFRPWLSSARAAERRSARAWSEALADQLDALGATEQIEQWITDAEEQGDLDRAGEHRQTLQQVEDLLKDLAAVLPDEALTLRELAQVVDSALAQFALGLVPPTLDQVLVTGIDRSRNPDLKVLFVLGFNDGIFPQTPTEDAILNDDDRTWLSDGGLELGTTTRDAVREERFLAYVAVTRPSIELVVSYAVSDESGRAMNASPYVSDLLAAFPDAVRTTVDDPFLHRRPWAIRRPADLAAHLAYEFAARPPRERDQVEPRKLWNSIYERVRSDDRVRHPMTTALKALERAPEARLSAESVSACYPETLHTSISRLETFAACPFKHFAEWNLKLEQRRPSRLLPVDVGRVHHAVLERFVRALVDQGRGLDGLSDEELAERLAASVDSVAHDLPEAGASLARDRYVIERSRGQLERALRMLRAISALGRFRPAGAELPFGFEGGDTLPPLAIDTPGGRRVRLRGIIDRVDLADADDGTLGMVIDYKRTRGKRLDLCQAHHGLAVQLLAYLLVLREHGESWCGRPVIPAAALYVSLVETYDKVDHPGDARDSEARPPTAGFYPPRGLLNLDHMAALDGGFAENGRSTAFQVALRRDGGISRVDSSDGATPGAFSGMLEQTARCMGTQADAILDGNVAVYPYRLDTFSPCSWCEMHAVCRFEFPTTSIRPLERLKRSEIFALVSA